MPQIFRIGSYIVYFWSNENDPLESVHVHIAEGRRNKILLLDIMLRKTLFRSLLVSRVKFCPPLEAPSEYYSSVGAFSFACNFSGIFWMIQKRIFSALPWIRRINSLTLFCGLIDCPNQSSDSCSSQWQP